MQNQIVKRLRPHGFTLLEVIVTIVIAAIMGVFFAQFVGTGVLHSADPVYRLQSLSGATHIMEYMTADYNRLAATQSNFLTIFKEYIAYGNLTAKPQGYEGNPYYGSYDILCNKYVRFNASRVEEDDPDQTSGRMLKVTIRRGDQTVTALFTR
jgi:prepilin-type N-terminal cleavage/methylation domain-containing protein